jgi:competence protein ComGC
MFNIKKSLRRNAINAFSVIAPLVGITIISMLAIMLFPSLAKSKEKAQGTLCANNLKEFLLG